MVTGSRSTTPGQVTAPWAEASPAQVKTFQDAAQIAEAFFAATQTHDAMGWMTWKTSAGRDYLFLEIHGLLSILDKHSYHVHFSWSASIVVQTWSGLGR